MSDKVFDVPSLETYAWQAYLIALGVCCGIGFLGWLLSIVKGIVSFVDSLWSLFFCFAAFTYLAAYAEEKSEGLHPRGVLLTCLVVVWGMRLSVYVTWRNWGLGEDARYEAIKGNNQPCWWFKSLFIVFMLQAVLAWVISLALLLPIVKKGGFGPFEAVGTVMWLIGFAFEAGGDYQLAAFKADPANKGKVLDRGFWRYTRHPNYFGDACCWWAYYVFSFGAGGWWTLPSPVIMTFFLLRVSGVTLLEKTITTRRPEYADYIRNTSAFLPWFPRKSASGSSEEKKGVDVVVHERSPLS